jgi:DNA helicase II / ATP-dependent DNA helicase PcrA
LKAEDTDEERRLLYVAMTRTQSLLYLSFPSKNSNGGRRNEVSTNP